MQIFTGAANELAAGEPEVKDESSGPFESSILKKSSTIRLGGYRLQFEAPPPPLPQSVSSPEACAAVESFCKHLDELDEQTVEMLEVSDMGIKFRRRAGRRKPDAVFVDLGLLGSKATSNNVMAAFQQRRIRKNLEDIFDAVRSGELSEVKFNASMISGAVYVAIR